ncbi:hypothetical protein B0I37DRAFT_417922 [Chaetomium sp. MPI-CAGE-AT-0009]|nr:hypothetical protein B0I37DRAFT_417922 [Chaetomium sp. MPI-CAGE-AT-0009]
MHFLLRLIHTPFLLKLPCILALTLLIQSATHTVPTALLAALARCGAAVLAVQAAVAVPSVLLRCELLEGFTGTGWRTPNDISILTGLYRRFWFWIGMWSFLRGFVIECLADWQLSKWRWDRYQKKHDEVFCGKGLWDRSRHPNYYGECLIWVGIAISCSSVVISTAGRRALGLGWFTVVVLCCITPYFVYKLLSNFSIPAIEERRDKMYMTRKDYRRWRRARTFRLWLDGSGIFHGYA